VLAEVSHRQSFGIVYEPLSPRQAERAVMRERTARHVAIRMRKSRIIPNDFVAPHIAQPFLADGAGRGRGAGRAAVIPPVPVEIGAISVRRAVGLCPYM
jgi:hypothetical protein